METEAAIDEDCRPVIPGQMRDDPQSPPSFRDGWDERGVILEPFARHGHTPVFVRGHRYSDSSFLAPVQAWEPHGPTLHRRAYKLDLIARVEAWVHGAPTPAPGPGSWNQISVAADEYRRVTVTGEWLKDHSTLVQAVTELGGGYWVISPLAQDGRGTTILVNRGFVSMTERDPALWRPQSPGLVIVTGLLRRPEPGGGFLRANDITSDRWYSRRSRDRRSAWVGQGRTLLHRCRAGARPKAARPSAGLT